MFDYTNLLLASIGAATLFAAFLEYRISYKKRTAPTNN